MKKILFFIVLCLISISTMANLEGKRIYLNPGHGSWGPNDRPMATIPYPMLSSTGRPDTCGFYESNTNLWKTLELGRKLEAAGAVVMHSRTKSGPYPYAGENTTYNKKLSTICAEAEAFDADMFLSVHSNAAAEGSTSNFPIFLYRGYDSAEKVPGSKAMSKALWPYLMEMMIDGAEWNSTSYSATKMYIKGDLDFYNTTSTYGYLGALKHNIPGFLSEGYFHTYQPARHRALNPDYCRQEGIRYYRGIADYFDEPAETVGYILGAVKDPSRSVSHSLYTYKSGTHDAYFPLNGATVALYDASGVQVGYYTVDNNYNGLYYFPELAPGTYTVRAYCKGYANIEQTVVVKANQTVYPLLKMSAGVGVPIVDESGYFVSCNYEENAEEAEPLMNVTLEQLGVVNYDISGRIKRTLQYGTQTIVLANEGTTPHLYLVDNTTATIKNLSLNGIDPVDANNKGSYLALSDIALTCDGVLVGCNYIQTQDGDSYVNEGYKRGTLQFYKWTSFDADPVKWVSTQEACFLYRANMGMTMALSGNIDDCEILVTGPTATSTSSKMRMERFVVKNGAITDNIYAYNANTEFSCNNFGDTYLLTLSPRSERNYIIDGVKTMPTEFKISSVSKGESAVVGTFSAEANNAPLTNTTYFKYARRSMMVTPYLDADGKVAGVRIYDVSAGLNNAVLVNTIGTNLDLPILASYASAAVVVNGVNFDIYLVIDGSITHFSTNGSVVPITPAALVYNLSRQSTRVGYAISFESNVNACAANLVFYKDGIEVGRRTLDDVKIGENTFNVKQTELPGEKGDEMTWAIEIEGERSIWGEIYRELGVGYTRAFNAVDNSPESDYFGQIYVMDRVGSANTSSGVYIYDASYQLQNTTPYRGGQTFGNPRRPSVDANGMVYLADWGDSHSGIYLLDPANPSGDFPQFFQGTRNSSTGVFTNNGAAVASSTPGVDIYGSGADTKLIVYNEDASGSLLANSVAVYNIGNADGSIMSSWGKAPSKVYAISDQGNSDGNVWGTSHGFFVSQDRSLGNNQSGAISLMFYDWNGSLLLSSIDATYASVINGSAGGGFALSADESLLVLNNGSEEFLLFEINWQDNKPILSLIDRYKHGNDNIAQMNFDYAGNLIASGTSGFFVYALPKSENLTLVPAKKSLTLKKTTDVVTINENDFSEKIAVWSRNECLYINCGIGDKIEVYSIDGRLVYSEKAVVNESIVNNLKKGIYIVRVNEVVVKIEL